MNQTSSVITRMLKENTGRAVCDSGDAYGRHWQTNQERNFRKEPAHRLSFRFNGNGAWEFDNFSHNVYHFLLEGLEYEPELSKKLRAFGRRVEFEDSDWAAIVEEFCIRNDMDPDGGWINTYNGEDMLSQTILYYTCGKIVFLRIHGGCDVRGGYTIPKVFVQNDDWLYNNARGVIVPELDKSEQKARATPDMFPQLPSVNPSWLTYDAGYSFECGEGDYKNLKEYEATQNPEERGKGKLYIDEKGNGYCPITGGKLTLQYY